MNLREHLETIYKQHGTLTPALVVEVSRPEDHPLHGHVFDRPPDQAAESWYRHRAHELIQRARITYKPVPDGEDRNIRAFVSIRKEAGDYSFAPSLTVAKDPFLVQLALRDMEREWRQLQDRYGHFREFAEMVAGSLPSQQEQRAA